VCGKTLITITDTVTTGFTFSRREHLFWLSAADLLTTARSREGLLDAEVAPSSYISNNIHMCITNIYCIYKYFIGSIFKLANGYQPVVFNCITDSNDNMERCR